MRYMMNYVYNQFSICKSRINTPKAISPAEMISPLFGFFDEEATVDKGLKLSAVSTFDIPTFLSTSWGGILVVLSLFGVNLLFFMLLPKLAFHSIPDEYLGYSVGRVFTFDFF